MKTCYHCLQLVDDKNRIGRRDTCTGCGADLRCCLNCMFHDPPSANACREPNADHVLDKETGNFCEYFAFVENRQPRPSSSAVNARAQLDALFEKK